MGVARRPRRSLSWWLSSSSALGRKSLPRYFLLLLSGFPSFARSQKPPSLSRRSLLHPLATLAAAASVRSCSRALPWGGGLLCPPAAPPGKAPVTLRYGSVASGGGRLALRLGRRRVCAYGQFRRRRSARLPPLAVTRAGGRSVGSAASLTSPGGSPRPLPGLAFGSGATHIPPALPLRGMPVRLPLPPPRSAHRWRRPARPLASRLAAVGHVVVLARCWSASPPALAAHTH